MSGVVLSGAVLVGSLAFAAASFASNLKDVRVGPHGEFTRVVLETDAKTSYSLSQTEGVVTVELQASATPKAVTAKSQQLSWVRVEPAGASTLVKIELKGPARVKQMVLSGPNRIVLDVYADTTAAARPPAPAPASTAAPPPVAQAPVGAETRVDDEAALVQREADALLGPEPGAPAGDEVAAAEGAPGAEQAATGEVAAETEPSAEAAPPEPAPPPVKVEVVERKSALRDWYKNPYLLGLLAIVMLALAVILLRRRPASAPARQEAAREDEETTAASLFAPSPEAPAETVSEMASEPTDSFGGGAASEPEVAGEVAAAAEGVEESASAFEFEAPEAQPEPEKPDRGFSPGGPLSTIAAVTSTAAYETKTPTATGGLSLPELERRLALLEQRLEEVIDAKDRLERQVSAQTEELRVQRAAIARTQRVLRTVVRPEDDTPSEPVLKS